MKVAERSSEGVLKVAAMSSFYLSALTREASNELIWVFIRYHIHKHKGDYGA